MGSRIDKDGPSASTSASISSVTDDVQQVKGLTFDTARMHFCEQYGDEAWDLLMESLPRHTRKIFDEADFNEWYPEGEMRRFMHAVHEQLAHGDEQRFMEIVRGLALAGISRFFRMLLGLASARFVLRKVPVVWKRLRRGPAELRTELTDDGRVLIHYEDFRYCRDPIYRQLSMANCQALVQAATGKVPRAKVLVWDRTSMTLAFEVDS